jgi:alpha-N-arabinofuranosidase
MKRMRLLCLLLAMSTSTAFSREYVVSKDGDDTKGGSAAAPFKTISAAAQAAQPGDVITVRKGVYRERINPPRGGISDQNRITYQAAAGDEVIIKGSEGIKGWKKEKNDTWKVIVPNTFFADFNPYADLISGDWFNPKGRNHHTGSVYLNGHWLTEAASMGEVLEPVKELPIWAFQSGGGYLLNVEWMSPTGSTAAADRIAADSFSAQQGIQKAGYSEAKECIGFIEHGDWVRYEQVNFGQDARQMKFRVASDTSGGLIEIRTDTLDGQLLGSVLVANTGGWQDWGTVTAAIRPTSGLKTVYLVFKNAPTAQPAKNPLWDLQTQPADAALWFAEVDDSNTTIWAQFKDINPNQADVEINVRQAVFYPDKPGVNYLTVRGFKMMHAATPWAPPTAEQIGLIGTHWSKGWIIENNDVRYSTCVGITLGKHSDKFDNTSADSAEGYVETIKRAHAFHIPWTKENIGHHVVRNNRVSHCEQAGIVGSLGGVFSSITGNVIHHIHIRGLFSGAEQAGIKIHASIDTEIRNNHIYRSTRGIWLDWMAQGTRVTANLLHHNGDDFFSEVNHGPYVVDNNMFLSRISLADWSHGGAYVHNLILGAVNIRPEMGRETPYMEEHSTLVAGLKNIEGGDQRFYNNIFIGNGVGLHGRDNAARPVFMAGNVFLNGATASRHETDPCCLPGFDPELKLIQDGNTVKLSLTLNDRDAGQGRNHRTCV